MHHPSESAQRRSGKPISYIGQWAIVEGAVDAGPTPPDAFQRVLALGVA